MISYRGDEGEYVEEFWMEKDEDCPYCGKNKVQISMEENEVRLMKTSSFEELHMKIINMHGPYSSLWIGMTPLYATVQNEFLFLSCRNQKHFVFGQRVIYPSHSRNLDYLMEMN